MTSDTDTNTYATHDTTMTLSSDESSPRPRSLSYVAPDIDDLFPMPDVSSHALASWKSSPMTHAVITLIHRLRQSEVSDAFRGNEDGYLLRKGRVEAFDRLLGEIDQLEAEILNTSDVDTDIDDDIDADIDNE